MKLNEKQIAALEEKGFRRWTKGSMDRLYINAETLGLEIERRKSGSVSSAYYRGERISNNLGSAMAYAKTYIDVATSELTSGNWTLEQDARQLYEETLEALAASEETLETTETTGTTETTRTTENTETTETETEAEDETSMKLTDEQIDRLEDAGFRLNEATNCMRLSYRALWLDPIWYSMEFRGVTYSQAEIEDLIAAAKKTYIDANTGELHSENPIIYEAAAELMAQALR